MGNKVVKIRYINVNHPFNRLSHQEKQNLKEAFDRIQDKQYINDYQFRMEVMGPQIPEIIGTKIFQMFSSDSNQEFMTYEDLICCYCVFKHPKQTEIAQLCYELIKLTTGAVSLQKDHLQIFVEKILQQPPETVSNFYLKAQFDPKLSIKQDEFVGVFKEVQDSPIFTWVPQLVQGFSEKNMNMDEVKGQDVIKRLTFLQNERSKSYTEKIGFSSDEYNYLNEFFNKFIKKNDAKEVLSTITKMFKDIKNYKLKKLFIEAVAKHKALDFGYFSSLIYVICKETNDIKKNEFLFDLFAQHSDHMKKKQMKDFSEIFDLGINFFSQRGGQIYKKEFIDDLMNSNIDYQLYENTKHIVYGMIGLQPDTKQGEKESILSLLDNNHNIEVYINQILDEQDTFFIVQKQFWDHWCQNVAFTNPKGFTAKKEKIDLIDNASLLEQDHQV